MQFKIVWEYQGVSRNFQNGCKYAFSLKKSGYIKPQVSQLRQICEFSNSKREVRSAPAPPRTHACIHFRENHTIDRLTKKQLNFFAGVTLYTLALAVVYINVEIYLRFICVQCEICDAK